RGRRAARRPASHPPGGARTGRRARSAAVGQPCRNRPLAPSPEPAADPAAAAGPAGPGRSPRGRPALAGRPGRTGAGRGRLNTGSGRGLPLQCAADFRSIRAKSVRPRAPRLQRLQQAQARDIHMTTKPSLNTLLQEFESAQVERKLPDFGPGDTVVVNVKVKEGNRERVQAYEGVVIGKKNAGLNS